MITSALLQTDHNNMLDYNHGHLIQVVKYSQDSTNNYLLTIIHISLKMPQLF